MTRLEALTELRDKVKAGETGMFSPLMKQHYGFDVAVDAMRAFNGSLDAAKALHDAVLPGCNQYSIVTDPTCLRVRVCWWPDGLSGERQVFGEGWSEDNPARAWLLAILEALIEQESTPPSATE
jgi:hypothetical protein